MLANDIAKDTTIPLLFFTKARYIDEAVRGVGIASRRLLDRNYLKDDANTSGLALASLL